MDMSIIKSSELLAVGHRSLTLTGIGHCCWNWWWLNGLLSASSFRPRPPSQQLLRRVNCPRGCADRQQNRRCKSFPFFAKKRMDLRWGQQCPPFWTFPSIYLLWLFLISLASIFQLASTIRHNSRVNAVLRPAPAERPDALRQAWQELLELRANQSIYADREFPVDHRLLGSLRKCGSDSMLIPSSSSMLSPELIEIYSEIGHLTRICPENGKAANNGMNGPLDLAELQNEFRRDCVLSLSAFPDLPSLPQIFGSLGTRLDMAQADGEYKDLQSWTREVVGQIMSIPGHEHRWKLLLIAPALHDIRQGQSPHRLAHSVLQSVHIIRHKLPQRTFVLILRPSEFAFWHTLARASAFCAKVLDLWNWEEHERVERAWEEVETRLDINFRSEDFYVEIADLMDHGRPLPGPDRMPDVSVIGPDCAHLSPRGLSLLHAQLWNWLLQPQARMQPFVPLVRPLLCPRPHCPFLLTSRNRLSCPRLPTVASEQNGRKKAWAALSPLAMLLTSALLLYALLAGCSLWPFASSSPPTAAALLQGANSAEPLIRLA